jgi:hypothetical protein
MNVNDMTRKQFESLPHRKWDEEIECNSIIILPSKISFLEILKYNIQKYLSKHISWIREPEIYSISGMHDSGYRCMDFVAVKNNEAICLLSGGSDVIHLDGIGGYGYNWYEKYGSVPNLVIPSGWNMDCLPKSGLLRLFATRDIIVCGAALSSFEVFIK